MLARRPFQTLVVAVAITMLAVPARIVLAADDAPTPSKHPDDPGASEARKHYEEGTKAFNLGEYPRAIGEFKAAYNIKPDPLLLYNIAQSFRLAGEAGQALFFYRSFLRNMPAASNRKEVEGRIRTLEKQAQVEEQKREAPAPVAAPLPQPRSPAAVVPVATTPPVATISPPATAPTAATIPPVAAAPVEHTPSPTTAPSPASSPVLAATEPAQPAAAVDLTQPGPDAPAPSKPFYKKWWFWTGIGALVLIGIAANSHDKPPGSTLGSYDPMFVKPLEGGR